MNTMKRNLIGATVITVSLMFGTCSDSGPNNNATGSTSADATEHAEEVNEEKFENKGERMADRMVDLSAANMFEIKASQEAMTRATTADVKKLAGMMVEAHTKMNRDMEALAAKKGVTLPTDMGDDLNKDLSKLGEKSGIDYDKEYLDVMKRKHENAEDKLERLADNNEDAEVKAFAAASLSEVRAHKDMIEATRNNVKEMKQDARKDKREMKSTNTDAHDGHADDLRK
jgi:putative membrane protein